MKKYLPFSLILLFSFGCSFDTAVPVGKNKSTVLDSLNGFCILFDSSNLIATKDIDYYDFSTHMVYLKDYNKILTPNNYQFVYRPFTVFTGKEAMYSGTFWPGYSNSMPAGAYIDYPSFYPAYVMRINYRPPFQQQDNPENDPRKDERIVKALKSSGLYHEGLTLIINESRINPGNEISITFTIVNRDTFNYYILSPEKMGLSLFHYFTNGLILMNNQSGILKHKITVDTTHYWSDWSMAWLEKLNGRDSLTWSISYEAFDPVPPGNYEAYFTFPGLSHIELADVKRNDGRVWLGSLESKWDVTVE